MTVHAPNGDEADPIVRSRRTDGLPPWLLRWIPGLVGFLVGIFVAGIATVEWGDDRYVRREEFAGHAESNKALEMHADADKSMFATKSEVVALLAAMRAELAAHSAQPGHAGVKEELSIIREKLAGVQADVAWLKERERRKGGGP